VIAESFWTVVVIACLGWYAVVTAYVAYMGAFDIRGMLNSLEARKDDGNSENGIESDNAISAQ
jgi:hypothetical protein